MTTQSVLSELGPAGGAARATDILGVDVAPLAWSEGIDTVRRLIRERHFTKIGFLNAHSANIAVADPDFAQILRDFLILPDGIGVDIASLILHGRSFPSNLNGTDFVPALLEAETRPLKVGLLGAKRSNAEAAVAELTRSAPQHEVVLINDGFFDAAAEKQILDRIKKMRPDILLVAMGVPRQEVWIAEKITSAHCTAAIAVGALFDFLSGAFPRAPLWVRRARLEWLYRLWWEPSRLWRRYILGNPVFLWRVLRQRLAGRGGAG